MVLGLVGVFLYVGVCVYRGRERVSRSFKLVKAEIESLVFVHHYSWHISLSASLLRLPLCPPPLPPHSVVLAVFGLL